jgi:hypothetical protein
MANGKKWSKAQHAKYAATLKRKATTIKRKLDALHGAPAPPVLDGAYVGEQPAVDVNKVEDRAFRRGLLTALQMVVDILIRELR